MFITLFLDSFSKIRIHSELALCLDSLVGFAYFGERSEPRAPRMESLYAG